MRKILIASVLISAFLLPSALLAQKKNGNSCVNCHKNIPKDTFIGENYMKWRTSVHSAAGITCDRCHGGNPEKRTRQEAHLGVYNSSNSKSKVFYKNVPRTCGVCHTMEYKAFRTSVHYEELQSKGLGPNCVSCHGGKAASIVTPDEMSEICTRCHNPRKQIDPNVPTQAYHALYLMLLTRDLLDWAEDFYKLSSSTGKKREARKLLDNAHQELDEAIASWHTFDVRKILRLTHSAVEKAKKARQALK